MTAPKPDLEKLQDQARAWVLPNIETHRVDAMRAYFAGYQSRDEYVRRLEAVAARVIEFGPKEPTKEMACWFCDMGDAGYSSSGPGHHDDKCPVGLALSALDEGGEESK